MSEFYAGRRSNDCFRMGPHDRRTVMRHLKSDDLHSARHWSKSAIQMQINATTPTQSISVTFAAAVGRAVEELLTAFSLEGLTYEVPSFLFLPTRGLAFNYRMELGVLAMLLTLEDLERMSHRKVYWDSLKLSYSKLRDCGNALEAVMRFEIIAVFARYLLYLRSLKHSREVDLGNRPWRGDVVPGWLLEQDGSSWRINIEPACTIEQVRMLLRRWGKRTLPGAEPPGSWKTEASTWLRTISQTCTNGARAKKKRDRRNGYE